LHSAVRELMAAKGYHATSIRDIARVAQVSSSALYHYAPSKEELVAEVVIESLTSSLAAVEEVGGWAELAPSVRLRALIRTQVAVHLEGRLTWGTAADEWKNFQHDSKRRILQLRRRHEAVWRQVLHDGVEAGEFQVQDLTMALYAIMGICFHSRTWFSPLGRLTYAELGDVFTRLSLQMLSTSEERVACALSFDLPPLRALDGST